MRDFFSILVAGKGKSLIFALPSSSEAAGIVAQLVEQRTENPCVGGSIPSDTTTKGHQNDGLFYCEWFL